MHSSAVAVQSWLLVLLLTCSGRARAGSLHDDQYQVLGMREPFRINSNDSDIGYGTPFEGDIAPIITYAELFASWPPAERVAVIVPGDMYTSETRKQLSRSENIAAVVLDVDTMDSRPLAESPAEIFPNRAWGMNPESDTQWNPKGDGSRLQKDSYATFSVNTADWDTLLAKATNNVNYPRW